MQGFEQPIQELSNVKSPAALVSLQFCDKEKLQLQGIEKFKNLVSFT